MKSLMLSTAATTSNKVQWASREFGWLIESYGSNTKAPAATGARKETTMYGYLTQYGFMGRVGTRWMLFASEAEYLDYVSEE